MSRQKSNNSAHEAVVTEIDVAEIIVPDKLMRQKLDDDNLAELKNSIVDCGLINPISVRKTDQGFLLLAGYRRYKAHVELKRKTIRASVYAARTVKQNAITLHENLIREDVNIADEAEWIRDYKNATQLNNTEIARKLNRSEAWIRERLTIADWSDVLKDALREGKLSLSVLREFSKCDNADQVRLWVVYGAENGVSQKIARNWVSDYEVSKFQPPSDSEVRDYEAALIDFAQPAQICEICESEQSAGDLKFVKVCRGCLQFARAAARQVQQE
jgi:ParB family chromosome partitioning protein